MNILRALGGGVVVLLLAGCGDPPTFAEAPVETVASNLPQGPGAPVNSPLTAPSSAVTEPTAPSATAIIAPDGGGVPGSMDASMGAAGGCDMTAVTSCGTCDNDCTQLVNIRPEAVSCVAGACQLAADACVAGFADCDGAPGCEASLSAAESCGACGNVCSPPLGLCASANGVNSCAAGCAEGELACGGSCVNPAADRLHCGECGIACGNNAACEAGVCACLPGFSGDGQLCCSESQAVVGGVCVDLGAAGAACGAELPCAEGLLCADGVCCFEQCGDNAACGADGECACVDGFVLVEGACIAAQGAGEACPCAAGLHCVDAVCCTEPSCPDNASCGSDGACTCAPGFQELNGNCAEEQPQGAACSSASPCAAGLFCDDSICCSEECGDDERCNENGEGCRCAEGLTRVGTECLAPQGAGASCAATPCQGGLTCVRDRCCAIDCGDNASCSNNGSRCNCDDGFFLTDDGCAPKRDNGSDCSDDEQCGSGACGSNGRCCAAPCNPTVANVCGHTGACSTNGACEFWGSNTTCAAADCDDGEATAAAQCNGSGTCVVPRAQSCGAYNCAANACRSSCTNNNHCSGDNFCDDGECTEPLDDGDACNADAQCDSGNCVDGLCCNIDCNAMAQSTCGQTGSCNANGRGCQLWSSATQCRSASCGDGAASAAAFCDGSGSCRAPVVTDCEGHQCNGTTCDTNCNGSDAQCIGDNICEGGDCVEPECSSADDCRPIVGQCMDGRCVQDAAVADAIACDPAVTSVTAGRGTLATPYCTAQLAVNHAAAFGLPRVLLRGNNLGDIAVSTDMVIQGDETAPPTLVGSSSGTQHVGNAIEIVGSPVVQINNLNIRNGYLFAVFAPGTDVAVRLSNVEVRNTHYGVWVPEGQLDIQDSAFYSTAVGALLNSPVRVSIERTLFQDNKGYPVNFSGDGSLDVIDSRFVDNVDCLQAWGGTLRLQGTTISDSGFAGLCLGPTTDATTENNVFTNNTAYAVFCQVPTELGEGNQFVGNAVNFSDACDL